MRGCVSYASICLTVMVTLISPIGSAQPYGCQAPGPTHMVYLAAWEKRRKEVERGEYERGGG